MSLFFRPERRDASSFPRDIFAPPNAAGVAVNSSTAMQLGAMWSSANLLASIVAGLPVDVFRTGSKRPVSPTPAFVASPSLVVRRREWVYQAMMSMLLNGNAYGLVVERDAVLRPRVAEWLDPNTVEVKQESALHRPRYFVANVEIPRDDVIHMRAFVRPGTAVGMSPVEYHAEGIGVGLAAQKHGAKWFEGGAHPTAMFKNSQQVIPSGAADEIKERLMAKLRGKREPIVVGSDWDYKPIQASAQEAQFLAQQGYTDAQIAKLYGPGVAEVLGYATTGGTSLTYSNRVDRSLDLLTYAVKHWVDTFEDMWTENIAQPQTARMNTKALLRMDPKTQMEMFRTGREIGLYNIDEERDLLDLEPLPDGQGQDYTPLKAAPSPTPTEEPVDGNE